MEHAICEGVTCECCPIFLGSSRDPGKVEVDRQGAGKLVVSKHTTTITLLSPCIILILPPS
ncbi:hypothetical protein VCX83_21295, partial [Aeromonas caviae]|uniref:hypothetical protein n=1 Tax=Aeromonas caviae TaxID=648 RepID=UPI002B247325